MVVLFAGPVACPVYSSYVYTVDLAYVSVQSRGLRGQC